MTTADQVKWQGARHSFFFTPIKLEVFLVVAEEGGFSAAARRLCMSQPALSQTIISLERRLGLKLFTRSTTGVTCTEAGRALVDEARAILGSYGRLLPAMARFRGEQEGVIGLGVPYELAAEVLRGLAAFTADYPEIALRPRHLPMAEQLTALRNGGLQASLMVQRPSGNDLESMLVAREELGVLVSDTVAARFTQGNGVSLGALSGLNWVTFPRTDSPAWFDELAAILRTHGVDVSSADRVQSPVPSEIFSALSFGNAFALTPRQSSNHAVDSLVWRPLVGRPIVRHTWAVWPANSRRRDLARLIATFDEPADADNTIGIPITIACSG
ncbi:LysR family transcriptional regulator [Mycobacterium sp. 21AC1]|uniref:LysR family transcriptional regulator n=1 Tax=[Mycobacterium] appelbergii TaxID=2939269 RepID=UPI002938E768|nr:LysR family transcriptional regulator [Mycobacterium sp. 21AC1]MDV3128208.1 LysR family transcriptional regulator [Mycobacterium sp. 21AC1]